MAKLISLTTEEVSDVAASEAPLQQAEVIEPKADDLPF